MIKTIFTLFALSLLTINTFCQDSNLTINLKRGNEAFYNGNYILADSLLSLCIEKSVNGDILYNRAFARLYLKDTCGFCKDLEVAKELFLDKESEKLFNSKCLKYADTTFYSKTFVKVSKEQKYRYYEVKKKSICDTMALFDIHDKRNKTNVAIINSANLSSAVNPKTGCIDFTGRAYLIDTTKIFYYIKDLSMNMIINQQFINFDKNLVSYIDTKYKNLKKNENENIYIHLKVFLSKEGIISNVQIIDNKKINKDFHNYEDLKNDITKSFKSLPTFKPALFLDKPVDYESEYILKL